MNEDQSSSFQLSKLYKQVGFKLREAPPSRLSRVALGLVFSAPVRLMEHVLFSPHPISLFLQKALQHALGGPRPVQIQFVEGPASGRVLNCLTSEKYFLQGNQYERAVGDVLTRVVSHGCVTYEIGSHVGYWALCLSSLCGPNGHVFAFEPSEGNYERLTRHLSLNCISNVTAVKLAAFDVETSVSFLEGGSISRIDISEDTPSDRNIDVRTIRLDDFVYRDSHPVPNLLLIDVEGFAGNVLRGAGRILRDASPSILCEIHSTTEQDGVLEALAECSYTVSTVEKKTTFGKHVLATIATSGTLKQKMRQPL